MDAVAIPDFPTLLDRLLDRKALDMPEANRIMSQILDGELGPERIAAFVTAIRAKPLDAVELAGFAQALRSHAHPVRGRGPLLDTCGTGAARVKAFNVSTAAAFVAAAAGIRVAKHGNRSVTRPSGSADALESAGAQVALEPAQAERILARHGIVFLHAPAFHPAMKHTAPVRQALGVRTVFNLLGPLANPAGATHQVVGVHDVGALRPMAEALRLLGVRDAYVLHGEPGYDEASVSGQTHSLRVQDGGIGRLTTVTPEGLGVPQHDPQTVLPVSKAEAGPLLRRILAGEPGPRSDMVAVNAAFSLHLTGRVASLQAGVTQAQAILRSGRAAALLDAYVQSTQALQPTPSAPQAVHAT